MELPEFDFQVLMKYWEASAFHLTLAPNSPPPPTFAPLISQDGISTKVEGLNAEGRTDAVTTPWNKGELKHERRFHFLLPNKVSLAVFVRSFPHVSWLLCASRR